MSDTTSPTDGANSELRVHVSKTVPPVPVLSQPSTSTPPRVESPEDKTSAAPDASADTSAETEATSGEPDADKQGQGEEQTDEQRQPKRRNRQTAQERISELTGKLRQAESDRNAAERRLARLSKPVQPQGDPADMTFDEAEAMRLRNAIRAERAAEVEHEARSQHHQAVQHRNAVFAAKVDSVAERMPDLWQRFDQVPCSEFAADFIAESEKTVEIAHFLASNPKEAQRIARLPDARQGIELARIEARLERAPASRKVSSAPPPHTKIAGAPTPASKEPSEMTYPEYVKWMESRGL